MEKKPYKNGPDDEKSADEKPADMTLGEPDKPDTAKKVAKPTLSKDDLAKVIVTDHNGENPVEVTPPAPTTHPYEFITEAGVVVQHSGQDEHGRWSYKPSRPPA